MTFVNISGIDLGRDSTRVVRIWAGIAQGGWLNSHLAR